MRASTYSLWLNLKLWIFCGRAVHPSLAVTMIQHMGMQTTWNLLGWKSQAVATGGLEVRRAISRRRTRITGPHWCRCAAVFAEAYIDGLSNLGYWRDSS